MSLEQLLEDAVIDEALGRLKSGKEADVWLVRHRDEVLCAKIYKDRQFRSFKNNSGYKEGRSVRNSRTQRAMERGSRFGQAAAEDEWKAAESDALHKLHAQGVRVPAPVLFYEGTLLMKLVVDAEGHPAPRLIDSPIAREDAARLYADLRQQAVKMLCADLIHGDLSPYNVLLSAEGPVIIDFPQVVSAAQNSTAESFFLRDIENVRKFFEGFDPALAARHADGPEIWRAYVRRDLSPDFVPPLRPLQAKQPQRSGQGDGRRNHPHGRPQQPAQARPGGSPSQQGRAGGPPNGQGKQRHGRAAHPGRSGGKPPLHVERRPAGPPPVQVERKPSWPQVQVERRPSGPVQAHSAPHSTGHGPHHANGRSGTPHHGRLGTPPQGRTGPPPQGRSGTPPQGRPGTPAHPQGQPRPGEQAPHGQGRPGAAHPQPQRKFGARRPRTGGPRGPARFT